MHEAPRPPRRGGRRLRLVLWWVLGVALALGLAGILLSTVFAGASIVLYPKTQAITPPATIQAQPNAPTGVLAYQTMSTTQSASTTATASGTQHITKTATGIVTIFNAYSTASQELVAKTRFAAPDGKIYRIQTGVTVPGATKKAGGTLTPGSTTASVVADASGPDYNRTQVTHFTLPGFAGKAQYTKVYAQSQGAIAGGFAGEQAAISPADMTKAQATLQTQLGSAVAAAAKAQIPDGFLAVTGSLTFSYSDIAQSAGADNTVVLSQSASAVEAIFRTSELAAALAAQTTQGYAGEPVTFVDSSALIVSVPNGTKPTGPLSLGLAGTPTLLWQFDIQAVQQALLGKPKSEFETIIKTFQPGVTRATATIRPFWQSTFPTEPSKLTVVAAQQ